MPRLLLTAKTSVNSACMRLRGREGRGEDHNENELHTEDVDISQSRAINAYTGVHKCAHTLG